MRVAKIVLVWAVAVLMAVDSASACRWGWSYCSPAPCYYRSYSCGPVVPYSAADCPICARARSAPVTTNRVPPAQPATPTPQPTLEPTPPAAKPAPAEPLPPAEPGAPAKPMPGEIEPFAPPTEKAPPEQPAPKPEGIEDLFKEPAPSPMPETPAQPGDNVEDLFQEPGAPAATPEAPAQPGDNVDDLFKEPAAPAADEPAKPEPSKPGDAVDDLFKDTSTGQSPPNAVAQAKPQATDQELEALFVPPSDEAAASSDDELKALQDEVDKLFAVSTPADEDDADAMRLWTDNTGKYHVRARLAVVGAAQVRLLKENGKYTTVPFERLSAEDLAFVRRHADAIAASF